jgi:hypothetical protein
MKNLILYLMLLITIPATAQSGIFGRHSHHANAAEGRHHHGSLLQHGPQDRPYTPPIMDPEGFEAALRILSKESFDSKRLDIAKQIAQDNWMSTQQIVSICKLFTYESNRLDFAKFAYHSCVNRNMYFMLDEVFTYSSSKDELQDYIQKTRHQ